MSLKTRLDKLEARAGGAGGPGYVTFETLAEYEAAEPKRVKAYIGVSPDDWPNFETEVSTNEQENSGHSNTR